MLRIFLRQFLFWAWFLCLLLEMWWIWKNSLQIWFVHEPSHLKLYLKSNYPMLVLVNKSDQTHYTFDKSVLIDAMSMIDPITLDQTLLKQDQEYSQRLVTPSFKSPDQVQIGAWPYFQIFDNHFLQRFCSKPASETNRSALKEILASEWFFLSIMHKFFWLYSLIALLPQSFVVLIIAWAILSRTVSGSVHIYLPPEAAREHAPVISALIDATWIIAPLVLSVSTTQQS